MLQTIAVTGGNGKLGKAVLAELDNKNYETVNVARGKRREELSDSYIRTDLLDAGNVYGALVESNADAVVHAGTIPGPGRNPGYEVYESNVMSTYHILEAASALNLESVCIASSINAMGAAYQDDPIDVRYLPVDEKHPVTPRDPYAISKHSLEVTCDGFGRQDTAPKTISTIRYPWIATSEELRTNFKSADRSLEKIGSEAMGGPNELFTYIHIDDAARVTRKALEANFVGHERFWAVASDTTLDSSSDIVAGRYYPDAELRESLSEHQSLVDIDKARKLLDWAPNHTWREVD
ncbi:NAD-dependent epimerase/dehydratase family protein [Halocatena marina]|uniref:NAD-dependent epimerase/dehydratase family protein n=1 Tax=Halocatena marina TaxID=2934937 RepID=A0ABD5YX59_9EURY|nr:NAD(P)-dependent oxidoreductase [Halocatena marina]